MNGNQKQLALWVPLDQWKKIRLEAAKQKIPMTELIRQWIEPKVKKLK